MKIYQFDLYRSVVVLDNTLRFRRTLRETPAAGFQSKTTKSALQVFILTPELLLDQ